MFCGRDLSLLALCSLRLLCQRFLGALSGRTAPALLVLLFPFLVASWRTRPCFWNLNPNQIHSLTRIEFIFVWFTFVGAIATLYSTLAFSSSFS